jgi:hypothetical protein
VSPLSDGHTAVVRGVISPQGHVRVTVTGENTTPLNGVRIGTHLVFKDAGGVTIWSTRLTAVGVDGTLLGKLLRVSKSRNYKEDRFTIPHDVWPRVALMVIVNGGETRDLLSDHEGYPALSCTVVIDNHG